MRVCIAALSTLSVASVAAGQSSKSAQPQLLPEAAEIALALSAAPAAMSAAADVYVLTARGHTRVRSGTNGMACLVTRDHPESLYPICYDREATRTVLPLMLERQKLQQRGLAHAAAAQEIESRVQRGELARPTRGAIAYMMSPRQIIFATPEGPRVGQWFPHIMIYYPYATAAELAIPQTSEFSVAQAGTVTAHLLVKVRDWSGTR